MKIMVVDDHVPTLLKISAYINSLQKHRIIGVAHDGHELIKFCYQQKELPDIVLLDVQMQKMDGVTTMEFMGTYFPAIKIIAVSSHAKEGIILDMLAGGAWGYVCKDNEMSALQEALLSVTSNQPYVDKRLVFDSSKRDTLIKQRQMEKKWLFQQYGLSPREKEILALLVSNMDYQEIGEILTIAPKTIEHTVNNLTKKFGITNGRSGLLLHSLRLGLTKMVNLRGGR